MKARRLKNVQQKQKQHWYDYSDYCPDCRQLTKEVLNSHKMNWRERKGKFEVKGPDKNSLNYFLYTHGVGKHE